ncbi:MAG: hypothetical protein ACYTBJ_19350 [Planctomycetota bacterium]
MLTAARFIQAYGAGLFLNEAWPTRDHVIPWRLFLGLFEKMDAVWARRNLEDAQAIMVALVNVMGKKDGPGRKILRDMKDRAYPEEAA